MTADLLAAVIRYLNSPDARGGVRVVMPDGELHEVRLSTVGWFPTFALTLGDLTHLLDAVRVEWPFVYPEEPPAAIADDAMTGPDCYRKALYILAEVDRLQPSPEVAAVGVAGAQVYATLAQALATVDARRGGMAVWDSWPGPS